MNKKEDYDLLVINNLKSQKFNVEFSGNFSKFSTIKVTVKAPFDKFVYYLIIWHEVISDKNGYLALCNTLETQAQGVQLQRCAIVTNSKTSNAEMQSYAASTKKILRKPNYNERTITHFLKEEFFNIYIRDN
ncbi:918_t:CDS:1 [Racocetra fulgida]|uniref:918_t:CDS:1 n=1 Tax=Racocetra fulgida TaxID=60492 RepID=A0A9N8ZMT2_9GLOM|nr:918_t:CDS:1 [Racocetra fulgida]